MGYAEKMENNDMEKGKVVSFGEHVVSELSEKAQKIEKLETLKMEIMNAGDETTKAELINKHDKLALEIGEETESLAA